MILMAQPVLADSIKAIVNDVAISQFDMESRANY